MSSCGHVGFWGFATCIHVYLYVCWGWGAFWRYVYIQHTNVSGSMYCDLLCPLGVCCRGGYLAKHALHAIALPTAGIQHAECNNRALTGWLVLQVLAGSVFLHRCRRAMNTWAKAIP